MSSDFNCHSISPHIEMVRYTSGPYHLVTYVLICLRTGKSVIIDPGGPWERLSAFVDSEQIVPVKILNTHGHADQFFSTKNFKEKYGTPSCLHAADNRFFSDPAIQKKTFKEIGLPPPYPADVEFSGNDTVVFGRTSLTVIHTPGHTPGSVCFLLKDHLFTGDTLFPGEAGRTDLPGGNLQKLIQSIKTKIVTLNSNTVLHPAHHRGDGIIESSIKREMKENIYITDFILDS